jgi:hypothetical protein
VSARITPLRLEAFEQLPKHARRCVFWEVDPATLGNQDHLADPEFEKEAWLSMVMLEWGSCGQVATVVPDERSQSEPPCLGYVFYAPPRAVPRAQRFPTGPVSADAVLLTSMGIEPGQAADDLPHGLLARVIDEMVRRGVGHRRPRNCRIRGWWVPMCGPCWRPSAIVRWSTASSKRNF